MSRERQLEYLALDTKPTGNHPVEGIPQLFSEQLHLIQHYIHDIDTNLYVNLNDDINNYLPLVHCTTMEHNTIKGSNQDTRKDAIYLNYTYA
jgi:hypothetical protein